MGINPKKLYKEQKRKMMNLGNLELQKLIGRIVFNPKDVGAYCEIGVLYANNGQYDEAISYFDEAILIKPDIYTYTDRGNAYLACRKYGEAIADFDKAIEVGPQCNITLSILYHYRGLAYQWLGKHDLATVSFDLARQMNRIHEQQND